MGTLSSTSVGKTQMLLHKYKATDYRGILQPLKFMSPVLQS